MSARAPEKAIVMRSNGRALLPTDVHSEEAIASIKGKEVLVFTERARNPKHHAKFMAMVTLIFNNQSKHPTRDGVIEEIKYRTGHFTSHIYDGKLVVTLKSLKYASMDQTEFEAFYERALDVVEQHIAPGMKRADVKRELLGFTRDNRHPAAGGRERAPTPTAEDDMA